DARMASLRETLSLTYPSYILALAMGTGKTLVIGAILATELALAAEHPDGPFVRNALVFAPGKTILESLRELTRAPYHTILPPRLHRRFAARVKIMVTRDGSDELPIVRGSTDNVVVTNTEKIRIQTRAAARSPWRRASGDESPRALANERLRALATLPALAIFADEAHHTYGQTLAHELKKVRQTVDYLAGETNLVCVVNTTGTPYCRRRPLLDVVCWYGLRQAIEDGVLKSLAGNIHAFDASADAALVVEHVVTDFFRSYGDVTLANGARAKLAIYFSQTQDLAELRPVVERTMARLGQAAATCLTNTSVADLTTSTEIDAFHRLNDPAAPHRVVLLVNKGTEGWDCPSLFACALVRPLRDSHNFVLQAATRCLRQVPGNTHPARVYVSQGNLAVLDRELRETYGESVAQLDRVRARDLSSSPVLEREARAPAPRSVPPPVAPTSYRLRGWRRPLSRLRCWHAPSTRSTCRLRNRRCKRSRGEPRPRRRRGAGKYAVAVELAARYRLDDVGAHQRARPPVRRRRDPAPRRAPGAADRRAAGEHGAARGGWHVKRADAPVSMAVGGRCCRGQASARRAR
ncbi:MAG: DEAD/DEAH box helicase family protein, partial [Planctomycetota bacterium]